MEIANALLEEEHFEEVIAIVEEVGENNTEESAVMAAETGGDLYVRMKIWEKSVAFYDYGRKLLSTLSQKKYEVGKGEIHSFTEEQKILQNRLERKRQEAQKHLDEDRFGPDWVAYKEAQEKHFGKDYWVAYRKYDELKKEYPDNLAIFSSFLKSEQKKLSQIHSQMATAKHSRNTALLEKYQRQEMEQTVLLKE